MSTELVPTFHGEVQLAGWSDTHNGGAKIVLWLSDPSELEAFRALTLRKGNTAGQRFMVAMVEIGDDELPVQPPAEPARPAGGPVAKIAGQLCADPDFLRFLQSRGSRAANAYDAAEVVRRKCGVESRAELDHNAQAARTFHDIFRRPFIAWQESAR